MIEGEAAGQLELKASRDSVLLLVRNTNCEITARYGLSAGTYLLVIEDEGAELPKSSETANAVDLEVADACPTSQLGAIRNS